MAVPRRILALARGRAGRIVPRVKFPRRFLGRIPLSGLLALLLGSSLASAAALSVDPTSREAVRQFYLSVASIGEDVPAGWTGSINPPVAGTTTATFKDAVLLRINALRALAGVPATVTFDPTYSAKAQQAALMMSANSALSHNPPTNWIGYTADGAEAAGKSNLAIGEYGPHAITYGYIGDSGGNNAAVGHRRWILYPQTQLMGTGDVPASGNYYPANATWILDSHATDPRPATRTSYVAWPAAGWFPAPLIFPRWSFSYPGANFSGASVTMTRDGAPVAVQLEPLATGLGENTLVWVYGGLDSSTVTTPTVTVDSVFHVTVSNVVIGGAAQNFEYDVRAFDPERAGSDTAPVTVTGSASPSVGVASTYSVSRPAFADALQWRSLQVDSTVPAYDAENGFAGMLAPSPASYSPRTTTVVGAGTASYRLATDAFQNQYLTAPELFYVPAGGTAQVSFLSRLGFATPSQVARVQVSTNDGASWSDVYTQAGNGSNTAPTESAFTTRTVALSSVAGLTFKLRFAFTFAGNGTLFTPETDTVGWFLDNIALSGVQRVAVAGAANAMTGTSFNFTPTATGAVGLQARGLFAGTYPMGWGPVLAVTAVNPPGGPPPAITVQPQSHTLATGATVVFEVTASGSGLSYQWSKDGVAIAGATSRQLVLAAAQAANAGRYTVTVSNTTGSVTSSAATLAVSSTSDVGRIINLSVRTTTGTGDNVLIVGFVTGGPGTSGAKELLIRGLGPQLTEYGVPSVLADPLIQLKDKDGAIVAVNDNWSGAAALRTTAATVGAQPLTNNASKDAALIANLAAGPYTVRVAGVGDTTGTALAEVYDTSPAVVTATSPQLINISARAVTNNDNPLIAGFVITGSTAKTVIIRGVGPYLAQYFGAAAMTDPTLELYSLKDGTSTLVASNDNWGGSSQLAALFATVGAFALNDGASKDATLVLTLDPGVYTAQLKSGTGAAGIALEEVYAVP